MRPLLIACSFLSSPVLADNLGTGLVVGMALADGNCRAEANRKLEEKQEEINRLRKQLQELAQVLGAQGFIFKSPIQPPKTLKEARRQRGY